MSAPYGSTAHALGRAFSAPRANASKPSIWATGVRGFGDMTSEERVASDGIVQAIAIEHCQIDSLLTFRLQWEGEIGAYIEAMDASVRRFRGGGRRARRQLPREFWLAVMQRWAHRKELALPMGRRDEAWAEQFELDRKTVREARLETVEGLQRALNRGLATMDAILVARGFIRDARGCG